MPNYKSYCWGLGTTSFRMVEFNKKIERQLRYLTDFWELPENLNQDWINNNELQIRYYNYLHQLGFIEGEAPRKDKDAREKTSGLVDLGLITDNRKLTEVGQNLLNLSESMNFDSNNILQISSDSFIYFKQLLKVSNEIDGNSVRPYIVLSYALSKLNEITKDEFTYLMPLAVNQEKLIQIIEQIPHVRNGELSISDIIISHLMSMPNYQEAYDLFLHNQVTEELIMDIGMNRKSKNYDRQYYNLFVSILEFINNQTNENVSNILTSINGISGKAKILWKQYIFNTSSTRTILNEGISSINLNQPLFESADELILKERFFKLLHLFKAKSLLSDYYDLNKRYFKTSKTILFQDNKVKLDIIPNCFFKIIDDNLLDIAFSSSNLLEIDCSLEDIDVSFNISNEQIYRKAQDIYGVQVRNLYDIQNFVEDERYRRFNEMIDNQFTDENLITLLNLFENRNINNDSIIQEMVTNNADIPTIFEYILAIIWYKISEKTGQVLEYMNLSLDADLLPISHASGGHEDITYRYEATNNYPQHTLLIEATLASGANQRRMEMEPVSRHLGEYILNHRNERAYCVFATTFLHLNVVSDFRMRKISPYYSADGRDVVNGMKIIPIQTTELKTLLESGVKYGQLYSIMEQAFNATTEPNLWYNNEIVDKI